jgi:hypothetical protein
MQVWPDEETNEGHVRRTLPNLFTRASHPDRLPGAARFLQRRWLRRRYILAPPTRTASLTTDALLNTRAEDLHDGDYVGCLGLSHTPATRRRVLLLRAARGSQATRTMVCSTTSDAMTAPPAPA